MSQEKIIEKIRKLLAHANDNAAGSENERDVALKMAYKLIKKHNIDESKLRPNDARAETTINIEVCPWRRWVVSAIGSLFFCKTFVVRVKPQLMKAYFIGNEDNSITAAEMAAYVIKSITKEGGKRRRELYGDAKGEASKFETSFFNAAAIEVASRCSDIRNEAVEEEKKESATTGTALVLASFYDNEMAKNEKHVAEVMNITLKAAKTGKIETSNSRGLKMGTEYGKSIQLNKQLN